MAQPYNTLGDVRPPDLSDYTFRIGAGVGGGLANLVDAAKANEEAKRLADERARADMAFRADFQRWFQDPTEAGYWDLAAKYPQQQKLIADAHARVDDNTRAAEGGVVSEARTLLQSGRSDLAVKTITKRREALKNSGDPAYAWKIQRLDAMVRSIASGEPGAKAVLAQLIEDSAILSGTKEPDKYMAGLAEQPFAADKAAAEARKAKALAEVEEANAATQMKKRLKDMEFTDAETAKIYAKITNDKDRLSHDKEKWLDEFELEILKLRDDTEYSKITGPLKQDINAKISRGTDLRMTASSMTSLADAFEASDIKGFGDISNFAEWAKQRLGLEDGNTIVKANYELLRSTSALAKLRGTGPVSNFELQTFLKGWPPPGADKETIVAYLRGAAKAAEVEAAMQNAQGNWMSDNGGTLGSAKKDMVVGGLPVKAGMSYAQFEQKYGASLLNRHFPNQNQAQNVADGFIDDPNAAPPAQQWDMRPDEAP